MKVLPQDKPDPKLGKPKTRSSVAFPYYDLQSSIEVAQVIQNKAGGVCDRKALPGLLGYDNAESGSFLTRMAAGRMFGVVEPAEQAGELKVTDLGRAIVAPISPSEADAAKVTAFLGVPLFKAVYERFNGSMLPEVAGLKNLLATTYNVVPARVAPTVRIMLASAEQAGFFKVAGDKRMVKPLTGRQDTPPPPAKDPEQPPARLGGGGSGGGGGPDVTGIPEALVSILRGLPSVGTAITAKRRTALVDAFKAVVGLIYPEPEAAE